VQNILCCCSFQQLYEQLFHHRRGLRKNPLFFSPFEIDDPKRTLFGVDFCYHLHGFFAEHIFGIEMTRVAHLNDAKQYLPDRRFELRFCPRFSV
jgi:hypothetical protein